MKNTKFTIFLSPMLEVFHQGCLRDSFPDHFHEHYVIGALLTGEREFYCAGKHYHLLPGQLVTINPGQIHKCRPSGNAQSSWLAIHFPVHTATRLLSKNGALFKSPLAVDSTGCSMLMGLADDPRDANLKNLLLRLCGPYMKSPSSNPQSEALFLAVNIMYQHFIGNNFNSVSLEETAAKANMGKFTFLRKFKKHIGISPYRYLEIMRLNKAREQLMRGIPISQCAQELGFHDQSHLNRQFRETFGFTPGALRSASLINKGTTHE